MTRRRGDNIPSVADYAHWNEEAEAMWYAENRYDMEHADEEIEDDDDGYRDYEPDPFEDKFTTEADARRFIDKYEIDMSRDTLSKWPDRVDGVVVDFWFVEHYNEKAHKAHQRGHA